MDFEAPYLAPASVRSMRSPTVLPMLAGVFFALALSWAWPWAAARGRPSIALSMFPPVALANRAQDHPLLTEAAVTYLVGQPSLGTLAPEYVRIELGATLTDDLPSVEQALREDRIDVLVIDDGSFATLDKELLAESSQRHGIVFVGINLSMMDVGEEVLGRYRSHSVRQAIADGVWGERTDHGHAEFASFVWAPSENHGSVGELETGFATDGAWGTGYRDIWRLPSSVETDLWNRDENGYVLAGSR